MDEKKLPENFPPSAKAAGFNGGTMAVPPDIKQQFLSFVGAYQTSRKETPNTMQEVTPAIEELQSLHDDLHAKNAQLAQTRDFAISVIETVHQPLLVLDLDLRIRIANQAFVRTFQVSTLEAEGQIIYSLSGSSWDFPGLRDSLDRLLQDGHSFSDFEVQEDFPNVGRRSLLLGACRMNALRMILLSVDDITELTMAQNSLRNTQDLLFEAQKMEAVGRIAGGFAHDFNNLFTSILGYGNLLHDRLAGDQTAIHQLLQIKTAGEKAVLLTKQLRGFSQPQLLQPKVLDLNTVVGDLHQTINRVAGGRINVVTDCEPALWLVRADPGEIGRALLNLALNARDAMPKGGTLTIKTANLTPAGAAILGLAPGCHVMMAVHDTGIGIDAEALTHIFEPFYAINKGGNGTGMGRATVARIVEQSGGVIRCESLLGDGTSFKIFLPVCIEPADKGVPGGERSRPNTNGC